MNCHAQQNWPIMPKLPELREQQLRLPFHHPMTHLSPRYLTTMNNNHHDSPSRQSQLPFHHHTTYDSHGNNNDNSFFFTMTYNNPILPFHHKSPSITSQPTMTSLHHPTTYLFPFSVSSHNVFLHRCDKRWVSPKSRFTRQSHNNMFHLADVAVTHPCSSATMSRPP